MSSTETWAVNQLGKLGMPDADEIIKYLLSITNADDLEEYLTSFLDTSQASHKRFIREFMKRQAKHVAPQGSSMYRKSDQDDSDFGYKINDGNSKQNRQTTPPASLQGKDYVKSPSSHGKENIKSPQSAEKKKTKYVNLYANEEQDVVMLSGRHRCDCQASKHKLINNCLKCGRIICEQEGSGPCPFCGNLVVTREEEEILRGSSGTKKSQELQSKLMSKKNQKVKSNSNKMSDEKRADMLQKAVDHKNKLLEFDRTSEKRTKVYDDENDYFNLNSRWISKEDRAQLEKREEELREKRFQRGTKSMKVDLLGRRLVNEENVTDVYNVDDPVIREILDKQSSDIFAATDRIESGPKVEITRPEYVDTGIESNVGRKFSSLSLRVQDRSLMEMSDDGFCLSMHQPWASLLVLGIKMHEGRTWYSSHRGRLWIAAGSKPSDPDVVKALEQQYSEMYQGEEIRFPKNYPTGCLLGCVDVEDVLPQEEYRLKYPDGESDCPYVFICENPREMILKFPIKGQHKIYKLESKIHQAAKKALKPLA